MPDTDVLGYLNSKGLHLKKAGGWEYCTLCPFHGEQPSKGKRGRFYINVDPGAEIPGLYFCHVCEAKGSLTSLKNFYGDHTTDADDDSFEMLEIFKLATRFYERQLCGDPRNDQAPNEEILAYLRGPGRMLEDKTIRKFHLGYAPMEVVKPMDGDAREVPSRRLYEFLKDKGYEPKALLASGLVVKRGDRIIDSLSGMVVIPYMVAGNVVDLRGRSWPERESSPKYKTCSGRDSRLFNTDAVWNVEDVVATEGEFDAMIMDQLGYRAVGFPGAKSYQDTWNGYFAPLKRVWLVFDRDVAGTAGMEKMREAIGPKARPIHLSEKGMKVDPTAWVAQGNGRMQFEELLSEARRGNLLVSVHDAVDEFSRIQGQPGLKFGWEQLDMMIDPGLQAGQLMIPLAKTGTGKTILLLNIMDMMRRVPGQEDLKILFFSLEQTRGEWWDRARRIYRFHNPEAEDRDAERWWEDNLFIVDRNRLSEADFRLAVEDFAYQTGSLPDLIMLDYLGYWARAFKGERYEAVSNAVMAMKGIIKDLRCPLITPHQVSRIGKDGEEFGTDAARDTGVIEETADFMLNLWSPDNRLGASEQEKTGKLFARIGKSRHGGRGALLELQFAPLSLAMVPIGTELTARARREFFMRQAGDTWEDALVRHRTGVTGPINHNPTEEYAQASFAD